MELPGNRATAVFYCKWNKHEKPSHIDFLSPNNNLFFTCELMTSSQACIRGPAASERHEIYSSLDGLSWLTIRKVEPGDEGMYICDISRGVEKTSSVAFLNYRQDPEVKPIDVKSLIIYPTLGNKAVLYCRWKVEQHPTMLIIFGVERKILSYCDLALFPYNCPITHDASSRHYTNSTARGLVSMIIHDVQPEDQGNYRCQTVKFTAGPHTLLFNVSDSYLTVKGNFHQGTDFQVRSSITYPTTGNQELKSKVTCNWNADRLPTFLLFHGLERDPLFTCQLTYIPYECIRGRLATDRHGLTVHSSGTVFMTINNLQSTDEGKYTCQVMKLRPGRTNIDSSVSYVYLSISDSKKNSKTSISSSPKETSHSNFLLIFTFATFTNILG